MMSASVNNSHTVFNIQIMFSHIVFPSTNTHLLNIQIRDIQSSTYIVHLLHFSYIPRNLRSSIAKEFVVP